MKTKGVFGILAAGIIVLFLGARAEAQLAKQGTYTTKFGWHAVGKTFEIDKEHVLFDGYRQRP